MHRNSAGFIQLPLIAYGAIGAAVVIAGLGIACKVQTSRLDALRQEYEAFKAKVEVLGQAAKKAAAEKEAADIKRKADTDALHQAAVDALNADIRRLRSRSPSSSFVPAAPATSSRPELACFDRADYSRADGVFTEGARRLADEGAAATLDLNSAKAWARAR